MIAFNLDIAPLIPRPCVAGRRTVFSNKKVASEYLVRKREKFRQKTENRRLRVSTILVIIAVVIGCFALVLFSSGVIQSQFKDSSSGNSLSGTALNTLSTAIPTNTLFEDYQASDTGSR